MVEDSPPDEVRCHNCAEPTFIPDRAATVRCKHSYRIRDHHGVVEMDFPQLTFESKMEFCSAACVAEWALDVRTDNEENPNYTIIGDAR